MISFKQEAVELSPAGQSELIAFLASIQIEEDEDVRAELTRKIDDNDPTKWIDLNDLQKRWAD